MSSWENKQCEEHVSEESFLNKMKIIGEKHLSDMREHLNTTRMHHRHNLCLRLKRKIFTMNNSIIVYVSVHNWLSGQEGKTGNDSQFHEEFCVIVVTL